MQAATRTLEARELEDEGDTFMVEEEDGATYCLSGQELPRGFPKRRVVISEAPKSAISFAVRMSGERVTPLTATIPFHDSPFRAAAAPFDRTVVPLGETFQGTVGVGTCLPDVVLPVEREAVRGWIERLYARAAEDHIDLTLVGPEGDRRLHLRAAFLAQHGDGGENPRADEGSGA